MVRRSSQSKSTPLSAVAEYSPMGMCTRPKVIAPFQSVRVEVFAMPFCSDFCVAMGCLRRWSAQAQQRGQARQRGGLLLARCVALGDAVPAGGEPGERRPVGGREGVGLLL